MQVGIKINEKWEITNIIKDTANSPIKYDSLVNLNNEQVEKLEDTDTKLEELYEELSLHFKETIDIIISKSA